MSYDRVLFRYLLGGGGVPSAAPSLKIPQEVLARSIAASKI